MNEERNWKKTLASIADGFGQPLIAVLISLLLGAVVIVICGENVLTAYGAMIRGAFGNSFYISETLKRSTPIIMGGLAVCIAWRSGYEAMGGEGQMILGAFCAALAAYYLPNWLTLPTFIPLWLHGFVWVVVAMLASVVVGALYSVLSGWLYERFEVTFIISTLMLNYIANNFASYMTNFVVKDPEALDINAIQTGKIAAEARLSAIIPGSVHWGFVLALIATVVTYFLFKKTVFGYKSRMGGLNPRFALYGGVNARKMLYVVLILSGAMAGLGGAFEALGAKGRYIDQMIFTTGYAWSGMVAALLANFNPIGTAVASILLAGLSTGGSAMQRSTEIPVEVCNMIEGIITLLMSVKLLRLAQRRHKARKVLREGEKA